MSANNSKIQILAAVAAVVVVAGAIIVYTQSSKAPPAPKGSSKKRKGDGADKSASPQVAAERLKSQGNQKFKDQDFDAAIGLYTQAIEADPNSLGASKCYANRAACHGRLRDYDNVIADCTKALAIDPRYQKAYQRRAQAYENKGDVRAALQDYTAAMSLIIPEDQESQAALGLQKVIEELLGRLAIDLTKEKLKEKKGQFPPGSIVKTYLNTFKNPNLPCVDDLRKAADEKPEDAEALFNLGEGLMQDGHYDEALTMFTKAKTLDPNLAKAYMECGVLLHLSGALPESLEMFEKAVELEPGLVEAYVKWANALFFCQEPQKADAMLAKAIELDKADTVAYYHAGQAAAQQGQQDRALELYNKVLELDPDNYEAMNHKGLALLSMGRVDEATRCLKKAISLKPKVHDAYNSYGLLLRTLERDDEAMEQFNKAMEVDPDSATAYTNKGFLMLHVKQDFDTAKALFEEAIRVDPACIEAYCNLAIVYLERLNFDKAVECYDRAVDLSFFEQDLATIYGFREAALLRQALVNSHILG